MQTRQFVTRLIVAIAVLTGWFHSAGAFAPGGEDHHVVLRPGRA
jgi:hypothetical protein